MKALRVLVTGAAVAAALLLAAAPAAGQYYTPLRYDLRYSSPTYIPSGTLRSGPADRPDPYSYGAMQYGNLGVTGNLRFGKSLQANVPYNQQGSQLSRTLPSLRLSDFRRDSYGAEDIGTRGAYGAPEPYFPGAGSVTNVQTAQYRFFTPPPGDRAPYTTPSLNRPFMGYTPPPQGAFYVPPLMVPAGGSVEYTSAGVVPIPNSAMQWVNDLIAGRAALPPSMLKDKAGADADRAAGLAPGLLDRPFGPKPFNLLEKPAGPKPSNLFDTESRPKAGPEAESPAPGETAVPQPERLSGAALKIGERQAPSPANEQAADEPKTMKEVLALLPEQYTPVSSYAAYVERGHAAMNEPVYDKAEALYAAAVALEPDRPVAVFGRLHALLGGRSYRQASVVLQRELARHPDWAKAAPNLKSVYANPEVYDRIVADLKAEAGDMVERMGINFLLGYVCFAGGDRQAARTYLQWAARAPAGEKPARILLDVIEGR